MKGIKYALATEAIGALGFTAGAVAESWNDPTIGCAYDSERWALRSTARTSAGPMPSAR